MSRRTRLARWAALVALSLVLAAPLEWAGFPAALLLGPMIAGIVFGVRGAALRAPRWTIIGAQAVIGCLVAHAITPGIVLSIVDDWAPMVLVITTTVAAGGLVGWVLVRFGTLPGTTAAWGSSPGAAAAMVAMSESFGADMRLVAVMQYLRVVLVVLTASIVARVLIAGQDGTVPLPTLDELIDVPLLPLLATIAIAAGGAWLGWRSRIPAGPLLVTLFVAATAQLTGTIELTLPPWLLAVAYAGLGWYVGLNFNRDVLAHALHAMPQLILATLLLIGLCALSAWMLTLLLDTDPLTAYLATSPGGLDSVTIIAIGSRADTPFVVALQTLRLFVVVLTGPPIAKLISRYA